MVENDAMEAWQMTICILPNDVLNWVNMLITFNPNN